MLTSETKKTTLVKNLVALFLIFIGTFNVGFGQISESFDSGLPTGYNTALTTVTLGSGSWQVKDVIGGTNGVQSGTKSAQLKSSTGAQIITPTLSGGVGSISFYVTASTTSGAYQVNVSTDNGASWSPVTGSPFTIGTTKALKNITVNNSLVNQIQIFRTGATIYVDDFSTTLFTPTCSAPTTQSSSATFSTITNNSMNLSWTAGNGNSRMVVMKEASAVSGTPTSGTAYTSSATFGSGATLGTGEYVVYNGTGNSVSVIGLNCGKTYHVKVYEYNTTGVCYNTTSPASASATTLITSSPSVPSYTQTCGSTTFGSISNTATESTFWQTSSSGTSETDPANVTKTVNSTNPLYLRAKSSTGCWSNATTVSPAIISSPSITSPPVDQNGTDGGSATFSVVANNATGYQWQISTNGGSSWSNVSGATSSSLTISSLTLAMNGYQYRVNVNATSPCTDVVSSVGTLSVVTGPCLEVLNFTALPSGWLAASITYITNEANFASNTGELSTLQLSNPNLLTFDLRRTSNSTAKSLIIEVSTTTQGGAYTQLFTYDHSNTTASSTTNCTIDLSAYASNPVVYIRFRKVSTSTSPWYLKNVKVFCGPTVPTLTTSITSLTNISYTVGSGPSTAQTFTLTGNNLDGSAVNLQVANTDFQISSDNASYSNSINFPAYDGTAKTIYVRLKAGLAVANYTDAVAISGGGVAVIDQPSVAISGAVLAIVAPVISSSTSQAVVYGSAASYQIVASQSPTSYSASGLPTGLSINATSGLISGTPTVDVGLYTSTINATNAGGTGTFTLTWNITPKPLTISGLSADNKVYDGNTTAALNGTATLTGIVFSDNVLLSGTPTTNFANKNVGTAKTVTISGYTLSGTKAGNYSLAQPSGFTANISAKTLTISGISANNKVYDGNTSATLVGGTLSGVISSDVVTLSGGGTFASSNAGTGISVTSNLTLSGADGGNYTLTQPTGLTANIAQANPVFNTSTITLNVGGTYDLPGANVSSTSPGAITYSISSGGNATLSGITISGDVVGTETLTVTQAASTNYNAGSTTVAVNVTVLTFTIGDYRTNPAFTGSYYFNSTNPNSSILPWQWWTGSAWVDVSHATNSPNSPEKLTTKPENIYLNGSYVDLATGAIYNNIIIEGGTVYSGNTTTGLTIASGKKLDIKAGIFTLSGKFNASSNSTIYVRTDAEFEISSSSFSFVRDATSSFIVENEGYVYINSYLANVWTGVENFAGESFFNVTKWDRTQRFFINETDISNNSHGTKFGYLDIDLGSSGITGNWTYVFPSQDFYLTHKDFYFTNSTSHNVTLNPGTMSIGSDFIINGTGDIQGRGQTGAKIFNVGGNFVKNGTGEFRLNTGTDITNPVELNVDGKFTVNAGKFTLDNGATTNLTSKVNLKGDLFKASSTYMTNSNTNSANVTFNFTGNSVQTVDLDVLASNDMLRYKFFVKNGASVKLINHDWKIATDSKVTIEDGGTLDFGWNSSNDPLKLIANGSQVNNVFELQAGGTLVLTSVDVQGAISTNGNAFGNVQTASRIYHPTSGSYVFRGLADQYYKTANSGNVPLKGKNLVIDNGTKNVYYGDNYTTWNSLDMKGGHIFMASNKTLELGENITNKGTLAYTSGYVLGNMKRWFNGTSLGTDASDLFPFGFDDSGFKNRFAKIQFTGGSPSGALTAFFVGSPMGLNSIPILTGTANSASDISFDITSTENQGYWDISVASGSLSTSPYKATLLGEGFTTITDITKLVLLKRADASMAWFVPGNSGTGTTVTYNSVAIPAVARVGISTFSHFGFGGADANPLPVTLTAFNVSCDENKNQIQINWTTASEQNSSHFIVEKSRDLSSWTVVSNTEAAGNSSKEIHYSSADLNASNGVFYYRLVQVDYNGESQVYGPISVSCANENSSMTVYPNPNQGAFTVDISWSKTNTQATLQLIDLTGKVIHEMKLNLNAGTTQVEFNEMDLQMGTYLVRLNTIDGIGVNPVRVVVGN